MPLLHHFSEDPSITVFEPRISPVSNHSEPLVWAVDAAHAYLYYFPRQCPRVTYYAAAHTSPEDRDRFCSMTGANRVAAIEAAWLNAMRDTMLFRYDLDDRGFELVDANAGYWACRDAVTPVSVQPVGDLLQALRTADVELRVMPALWPLYEAVVASTLGFSIIRWRNAAPRPASESGSGANAHEGNWQ